MRMVSLAALFLSVSALHAQSAPSLGRAAYTAVSTTAMGVTGDIRTAPAKLILHGHPVQLHLQRALTQNDLPNLAKLFSVTLQPDATAALYRVDIPGSMKFANGNTLCGTSATTFVVLLKQGSDLEMANFSGSTPPNLDPAVLNNSTSLCGTYGYTRK